MNDATIAQPSHSRTAGENAASQVTHRTTVELYWEEGRLERWIRFGHAVDDRILDRQRRILSFTPDSIFAFVRWQANEYGTVLSRVDVLRALQPDEAATSIGFMRPAGEILLRASGWPKVERVLHEIDTIELAGFDPATICPDHWRHIHNRLSVGLEPRAYTPERHGLWLARKALAS